ncbi:MAG: Acetyl-CoA decarbonylase/synthase complex subunit gamma 1 [Candidatus Argoarchaeum ethanivorans]|uniref:Acetyl-CoA decarbonylase/synthase complex subunit gamma n=1 Tax=Candidatus Argoarchaeum ethanivorans TaxID=2608793 RepID=A0A811TB10_9EURY|nr:MAG: Acetyl-CoA decarbonylase/synthase complex subunit gamma 1 [Candidatus Argoarchaeum ethanivorans]
MKLNSPLQVYKYLPKINCGKCGEKTCMAFASRLVDRSKKIEDCQILLQDKEKFLQLAELLAPEIREITAGVGDRKVRIGGDDVLHRHQLTFFNPTVLAYDVWDTMEEVALIERVKKISEFKKFYVGDYLKLDMIAVRSTGESAAKFKSCVKKVTEVSTLPVMLCSFDPTVLKAGLEVCADKKPVLYAATKDNWEQVSKLALEYRVPAVLFSEGDLDSLKTLAVTFNRLGINDLILDPGTYPKGAQLKSTFENFIKLRRAGIKESQKEIAYPIMAAPITAWMIGSDPTLTSYLEAALASIFMIKYADIMLLHSIEPHALLSEVYMRETMYTDPRTPLKVDSGVYKIGNPTKDSPVIATSNFALTYYTVESDLSSGRIDCYLASVNTDGIGVEAAVAGRQFTAVRIKETFDEAGFDFKEKTSHNTIILPGLAARLQGDLEDVMGIKVLIGPVDSNQIPGWMDKNWL